MIKRMSIVCAMLLGLPTAVYAHGDRPHDWMELWQTWGLEPFTLGCLTVSGIVYAIGIRRLWRASAPGKGIAGWEAACFALGWFSLFLALVSPLHPWGQVLFSAHMAQHEVMMLVAAPLLVLGKPIIAFLWFMPGEGARAAASWTRAAWWRRTWRVISRPLSAWVIHAVALWIWHLPVLFQATLRSEIAHTLQHVSFFGSALLFWWALLYCRRGMEGYGVAVLGLFTTALHNGLLGALLTFASNVWYPAYAATTGWWGLTPLEDQQLGGLIMWIPSGLTYVVAGLALFAGWLRESERRVLKREGKQIAGSTLLVLAVLASGCGADTHGPLAYVTNERDGTISVIDTKSHRVVSSIEVGARPRGIRMSPDGSTLYVARSTPRGEPYSDPDNRIVAVDVRTRRVTAEYEVGTDPEQLGVSNDGRFLFASNEDAGTATVVDVESGRPVATLIVGIEPEGVTVSPDGKWAYVTAETSNTVSVIDTEKKEVVASFLVGSRPRDTAFSPDASRAYVSAELGRTISVVETRTHQVIATIRLPSDEQVKPVGVAVSPDGGRIYVALGRANSVAVIDAGTHELIDTISVGERTWGIALTPDGKKLLAANGISNDVHVIDTETREVIAHIPVGDGPWGIAMAP